MDQKVNRVKVGMRMDMGWKGKLIGGSTSGSQIRTGRQAIKDILIWKAFHAPAEHVASPLGYQDIDVESVWTTAGSLVLDRGSGRGTF